MMVNGFPRESPTRSTSAACAPTSGCPTSSPSRSAAAPSCARRDGGAGSDPTASATACRRGARLRRHDPDAHRRRRPRRARRPSGTSTAERARGAAVAGLDASDAAIADGVDRMKLGRGDVPLIVVGGGSMLIPDSVPGVSKVLRPDHHDVANAIGAAIASVSGRWEEVVSLAAGREAAIEAACDQARARAIQAGRRPRTGRDRRDRRGPTGLPHRTCRADQREGRRALGPQ